MIRKYRTIRSTVLIATAALTLGMSAGTAHALDAGPASSVPAVVIDTPPVVKMPPIRHPLNPCILFPRLCDHPRRPDPTTTTVPSHPTGDPDPTPTPPPTVIVHASPNFTG